MNTTTKFGNRSRVGIKPNLMLQACVLLLCLAASNGTAQMHTVTNCTEATLRAAMAEGGTVTLVCDGTITLTDTVINQHDIVLDGSGHNITISGSNAVRVLYNMTNTSLTLINVTIADGSSTNGAGIFNDGGQLTLSQVVFQDNIASSSFSDNAPQGGGIFNAGGIVSATNCGFFGNTATAGFIDPSLWGRTSCGGAIQNAGGELNLENCVFSGNSVSGSGGIGEPDYMFVSGGDGTGGAINNSGNLNANGCTFSGNSATGGRGGDVYIAAPWPGSDGGEGSGGAVFNSGTATIRGCTFNSNGADGGSGGWGGDGTFAEYEEDATPGGSGGSGGSGTGGAICNFGLLIIRESAVVNNSCAGDTGGDGGDPGGYGYYGGWQPTPGGAGGSGGSGSGGALFNGGTAELINDTLAFNTGTGGAGGAGYPYGNSGSGSGGICGWVQMTNCTVAFNSGHVPVGASAAATGGLWSYGSLLVNSILASNSPNNSSGSITDGGHNLSSDNSCAFTAAGSLNNVDPMLGPLADNGGPTLTMALLPGSRAIDAGDDAAAPPTDQRGFPRPVGYASDIGAFESSLSNLVMLAPYILTQPTNQLMGPGQNAQFTVVAGGTEPLSYQWRKDGVALPTGTNATLTLSNVQPSDRGYYDVVVTNLYGEMTSARALLDMSVPVVTSLDNSGPGTLRNAIASATNGDTITFLTNGTIQLNWELAIAKDLNIVGPGSGKLDVKGGATRVFNINSNATVSLSGLTIRGGQTSSGAYGDPLTTGGPGEPGGGIYNAGTLTLCDCIVRANRTGSGGAGYGGGYDYTAGGPGGSGGGIYNTGFLTLTNCVVCSNSTGVGGPGGAYQSMYYTEYARGGDGGNGGGIYNAGTLYLRNSIVADNRTGPGVDNPLRGDGSEGGAGGGIWSSGTLIANDCTFDNNFAGGGGCGGASGADPGGGHGGAGGPGGAIYDLGTTAFSNCTFTANWTGSGGAGGSDLYMNIPGGGGPGGNGAGVSGLGNTVLINCTIATNKCGSGGSGGAGQYWLDPSVSSVGSSGGGGVGAGICCLSGNLNLVNCTITGNQGGSAGEDNSWRGGGGVVNINGEVQLVNSIVATNNGNYPDVTGAFLSGGHNLVGITNGSSGFPMSGDLVGSSAFPLDPKLGPLADNGGPTLTMALLPGSPAIDAGDDAAAPPTDQRGFPRPAGAASDIGAYECNPPQIATAPPHQTAEAESSVDFVVGTFGDPATGYLWFFNGTNLVASSTNSEWELTNCDFSQSGTYTVVVTNVFGAVTSAPVMLNVIPAVERRPVPGINVTGEPGSLLNVDYADSLTSPPNWLPLDTVNLTNTSQLWVDLTSPMPAQRFYRAWQPGAPGVTPSLDLHFVPAILLTGNIGDTVRLDYINAIGPTDAWVTLDTVTLTNASQLYFDTSSIGQPRRLYRIVPEP